jgi:hypothetical protein
MPVSAGVKKSGLLIMAPAFFMPGCRAHPSRFSLFLLRVSCAESGNVLHVYDRFVSKYYFKTISFLFRIYFIFWSFLFHFYFRSH